MAELHFVASARGFWCCICVLIVTLSWHRGHLNRMKICNCTFKCWALLWCNLYLMGAINMSAKIVCGSPEWLKNSGKSWLQLVPKLVLLGLYPKEDYYSSNKDEETLMSLRLLSAKKIITLFWKNRTNVTHWSRQASMMSTFPVRMAHLLKLFFLFFKKTSYIIIWRHYIVDFCHCVLYFNGQWRFYSTVL